MLVLETNASLQEVKKVAKYCGLKLNNFDLILTKEKVKHRKPNPELIKKAKKLFNISKAKAYVVGDSYIDILLARKARAKSIIVINKVNKKNLKEILKYKPNFIVENFNEIVKIIEAD